MPRRQLPQSTDNHERWLISYADFITLLFATFVVLYSTAAVNMGGFRVLSDSIVAAFVRPNVTLDFVPDSAQVVTSRDPRIRAEAALEKPVVVPLRPPQRDDEAPLRPEDLPELMDLERAELAAISSALSDGLAELLAEDSASLRINQSRVELELNASLLFPDGSRVLLASAVPILDQVADLLGTFSNAIHSEGYTDNEPVRNDVYDGNWELSSARATALVRELEASGIASTRLSATGYGEHRPIADNSTEAGRTANQRMVIVVKSSLESRRELAGMRPVESTVDDG